MKDELQKRSVELSIDHAVHFAGFIQPIDLPQLYAGADLFVLPTLDDTFGVVLAEAAASGLPLISTPYAGASEHFIEAGVNGYIADPTDHAALVEAMCKILTNSNRVGLGNSRRAKVISNPLFKSAENFVEAIQISLRNKQ